MHEVADYLTDTYNGPEAYHRNLNASMRPHPNIGEFLEFQTKIYIKIRCRPPVVPKCESEKISAAIRLYEDKFRGNVDRQSYISTKSYKFQPVHK